MTDTPMTPEYERRIREHVAEMRNYSPGNLFARDLLAEVDRLRARVADYERPSTEAERNALRQSFAELAAQAREDRDYEGAASVECDLREREEQWKREDAANGRTAEAADLAEGQAQLDAMRADRPAPCRVPDSPDSTCAPKDAYRSRVLPPRSASCTCGHSGQDHHHAGTKCWANLPKELGDPIRICKCDAFSEAS